MSDPIRITSKLKGSAAVVGLLRRFPEKISRTMLSLVKRTKGLPHNALLEHLPLFSFGSI